jgi:hypothetical protein
VTVLVEISVIHSTDVINNDNMILPELLYNAKNSFNINFLYTKLSCQDFFIPLCLDGHFISSKNKNLMASRQQIEQNK